MFCQYYWFLKFVVIAAMFSAGAYSLINLWRFFRGWKDDWDGVFEKPTFRGVEYDVAFTRYFYRRKYRQLPDETMTRYGDSFVRANLVVGGLFIAFLAVMMLGQICQ